MPNTEHQAWLMSVVDRCDGKAQTQRAERPAGRRRRRTQRHQKIAVLYGIGPWVTVTALQLSRNGAVVTRVMSGNVPIHSLYDHHLGVDLCIAVIVTSVLIGI